MPAYRSSAEAEIREAVVSRIRQHRSAARIIHEINAVNMYAGATCRIDVLAVDREEIIAVEIKSSKDKLTRLPSQIDAMRGVAHGVVVALHDKFLVEQKTNQWASEYERDGQHYLRRLPDPFYSGHHDVAFWVHPEAQRHFTGAWRFPERVLHAASPGSAIAMLWRDELISMCAMLRVPCGKRSTMAEMIAALRWHCTGAEITKGVCAALRARKCVEADPEIISEAA